MFVFFLASSSFLGVFRWLLYCKFVYLRAFFVCWTLFFSCIKNLGENKLKMESWILPKWGKKLRRKETHEQCVSLYIGFDLFCSFVNFLLIMVHPKK